MFVDIAKISVAAGSGGNGRMSFRSSRGNPKGGPDGGDGGNGGSIIARADHNSATLSKYRTSKLWKAEDGQQGGKSRAHGRNGKDLILPVAPGTIVRLGDQIIADLPNDGDEAIIAKGGKGGYGNAHFVSSTRQAPRIAELGEKGEERELVLELKLVADVGLVGLPNAGKSTLLSVVSNARPQIADYPFTTLVPNLGIMEVGDQSLVLADIPGLIEGAAEGKGLGDEFLRHVERNRVLLHLIDASSEDVANSYRVIMGELKNYQVDLSDRPQVVALSKVELVEPAELKQKVAQLAKAAKLKQKDIICFSAQTHHNLDQLKNRLLLVASQSQQEVHIEDEMPVISLKADDDFWEVSKVDDGYRVDGVAIERFAARTNFDQPQAVLRLRDILIKRGVGYELERQGASYGDIVHIGDKEIRW
ncbi:GTPase ObgE [bacterium]|nr:GTPase ObgE [bacterium]